MSTVEGPSAQGIASELVNALDNDQEVRFSKPRNQEDFQAFATREAFTLFRCKVAPIDMVPIKAPVVKGLVVFAAWGYGGKLYAAWTKDGKFVGWLHYWPSLSRIDHDFAVGEVLGRQAFETDQTFTIRKKPVARWVRALREAARTLGVA